MGTVHGDKGIRAACYKNELTPIGGFTLTAAAGTTNVGTVTIQATNTNGEALSIPRKLQVWISDDADGQTIAAVAGTGTVGVSGTDGYVLKEVTAKLFWEVMTDDTGEIIITLTDTNERAVYVNVANPWTGEVSNAAVVYG